MHLVHMTALLASEVPGMGAGSQVTGRSLASIREPGSQVRSRSLRFQVPPVVGGQLAPAGPSAVLTVYASGSASCFIS